MPKSLSRLLVFITIMYYTISLCRVLSLNFMDNYNFEKGLYENVVLEETRQNVRSRIICAGMCARTDSCAGLKFESTNTCFLYRKGQASVQLDVCIHLKLEFGFYHKECNETTSTDPTPSTSVSSVKTSTSTDPTPSTTVSSVKTSTSTDPTPSTSVSNVKTSTSTDPTPSTSVSSVKTSTSTDPTPSTSVSSVKTSTSTDPTPSTSVSNVKTSTSTDPTPSTSVSDVKTSTSTDPTPSTSVSDVKTSTSTDPTPSTSVSNVKTSTSTDPTPSTSVSSVKTSTSTDPTPSTSVSSVKTSTSTDPTPSTSVNSVKTSTSTDPTPSTSVSSGKTSTSTTSAYSNIKTDKIQTLITTHLSAAITTQHTKTPCQIDAAAELSDSLMLISGNVVYFYNDAASILTGPSSLTLATSIFPQVAGQIDAAYTSLVFDFIYIIKGKNVYTYSLPNYTFVSQQSGAAHFGLSENPSFFDNVIQYSTEVHIFSSNADLVKIKNGATSKISFTNSGNSNPYNANNLSLQPSTITAICHASNTVVLFFETNIVKQLEFGAGSGGKGLWTDLGSVSC